MTRCSGNTDVDDKVDLLEESWDNNALPIYERTQNWKFLDALSEEIRCAFDDIESIRETFYVGTATGENLEKVGDYVNVRRRDGESDKKLRGRILAQATAGASGATYNELVKLIQAITDLDRDEVQLLVPYQNGNNQNPSTLRVGLPGGVPNSIYSTDDEFVEVVEQAIKAGGEVEANLDPIDSTVFKVKADGDVDDPDNGLTSDNISSGGILAGDVN